MNMGTEPAPAKRRYQMTSRAEAAAATRERILAAACAIFWERPVTDISLEVVARRAGVSLPTVIRHFRDKETLFAAAGERESERIRSQRNEAPMGDARAAVRVLFDHYEEMGDAVLRLLSEEVHVPGLREIADRGRAVHEQWCEQVFAPALVGLVGDERARRLTELVVVTDVLVWRLLRRDRTLSRQEAELAMCELIDPLMYPRQTDPTASDEPTTGGV